MQDLKLFECVLIPGGFKFYKIHGFLNKNFANQFHISTYFHLFYSKILLILLVIPSTYIMNLRNYNFGKT